MHLGVASQCHTISCHRTTTQPSQPVRDPAIHTEPLQTKPTHKSLQHPGQEPKSSLLSLLGLHGFLKRTSLHESRLSLPYAVHERLFHQTIFDMPRFMLDGLLSENIPWFPIGYRNISRPTHIGVQDRRPTGVLCTGPRF